MFEALIQNYKDEEYFSSDTDERSNQLSAFGNIGTTSMRQTVLSRSGSGSSESSCKAPVPFVDLTGGPLEQARKSSDLDKTIVMTDETTASIDMTSEVETP